MENFNYKILLVEDAEIAQKFATLIFKELGCDVYRVSTGTEAIEQARKNQYQIILMDLGLPDIDGFAATKEIRKIQANENVLIIALTTHSTEEDKEHCFAVGMNDIIIKPISLEKAKNMLQKYSEKISQLSV